MKGIRNWMVVGLLCASVAQSSFAGAPLKGIDVKLGKNPGGGCAAKTSDGTGPVDLGSWEPGNYTLSFESKSGPKQINVIIHAGTQTIMRDIDLNDPVSSQPIAFAAQSANATARQDGGAKMTIKFTVEVSAGFAGYPKTGGAVMSPAKAVSHSNSNNN